MTLSRAGALPRGDGPGSAGDPDPQPEGQGGGVAILERGALEALLAEAGSGAAASAFEGALLMVEIGGVERVNRVLGYAASEEMVRKLGAQLGERLGACARLARLAEGRFAALVDGVSSESEAVRIGIELVEEVGAPRVCDDLRVRLSASVGVRLLGDQWESGPEALLRDAGAAAQAARRRGPNHVETFCPRARDRIVRALRLEAELCAGIERSELELHFQPIVSLGDAAPLAIEALARWRHPERGLLVPEQFIPTAEESGLIVDIGDWMLAEVCGRVASWEEEVGGGPCPPVSINVSARQLEEGKLEARLSAALLATGAFPSLIVIEITESSAMELRQGPLETVAALKALGVGVWLDDFGTGHSSLARLERLPVDAVKIDRAFVSEAGAGGEPPPILSAVVEMGRALGLMVIAEGVETAAQLAAVKAAEVDAAQGFVLARPRELSSLDEVRQLLTTAVAASEVDAPAAGAEEEVGMNEAAEVLGVSASTMRRLADAGALPVRRTSGGHRRFPRAEVRRLARRRIGETLLRRRELPPEPLARVAASLRAEGQALIERAGREIYEGGRVGWFVTPQGLTRTGLWLDHFSEALAQGRHSEAVDETASYQEMAQLAGASAAECVRFLTEFGQLAGRQALRAGAENREEVRGLQRIVAVANESFLERLEY